MEPQILRDSLRQATTRLSEAGIETPAVDARLLAAAVFGCAPLELDHSATTPSEFFEFVERRAQREPLQYIVGEAPFGPLDLQVGPGVFIPRPETEVLADWAVTQLRRAFKQAPAEEFSPQVVDLCTGSGALALYLAHYFPTASVTAVELSEQAAEYTRRNIAACQQGNDSAGAMRQQAAVELRLGDATDETVVCDLFGCCDLVLTNPPYVPETPDLAPEVYADPAMAVFGGEDGMDVINGLIPVMGKLLKPGGILGIEHDDATGKLVLAALHKIGGFADIAPLHDLTGRPRFVVARKI